MRALICIALVAAVYAGDKTWKEVKSCMEEKAQKCSEEWEIFFYPTQHYVTFHSF